MTTIIVKAAKDNAKRRKYLKTGAFFAQKDADRGLAMKISAAWDRLTARKQVGTADVLAQLVIQLRDGVPKETGASVCLPNVALFNVGHRKFENVTVR
ncbi:hypothetical protein R9X49_06450 [Pectobacterium carotovorum]|uniref:transcriptional antitermination N peptide n=1 Tax=Pectobacterium carotovorum TaxID=554 RepID=UPI0029D8155A|nr:hypothetical protein [Pectobacterium carotovorum]MDX6914746.1 hypothetical protein [Pectobacterium carotovorum]